MLSYKAKGNPLYCQLVLEKGTPLFLYTLTSNGPLNGIKAKVVAPDDVVDTSRCPIPCDPRFKMELGFEREIVGCKPSPTSAEIKTKC